MFSWLTKDDRSPAHFGKGKLPGHDDAPPSKGRDNGNGRHIEKKYTSLVSSSLETFAGGTNVN